MYELALLLYVPPTPRHNSVSEDSKHNIAFGEKLQETLGIQTERVGYESKGHWAYVASYIAPAMN